MNKNEFVLASIAITSDLLASVMSKGAISLQTSVTAEILVREGVDLDFVLVLAGANKDNLLEVTNLAYEELKLLYVRKVSHDYNRNGTKT